MTKIVEIKEILQDTQLIDNIYTVNKIIRALINETEFVIDINKTDYDYLNIVMSKTKNNLLKAYAIIKNNH